MKTALKLAMIASVVGCGSDHKAAKSTVTRAINPNAPTFTVVGEGGANLVSSDGTSVDGMFFGSLSLSASAWVPEAENMVGISLGESKAYINDDGSTACQTGLIKQGGAFSVPLCSDGYGTGLALMPTVDNFRVDFLVASFSGMGIVANNEVFIQQEFRNNEKMDVWSPRQVVGVNNLPVHVTETAAPANVAFVYANKDLFPNAFNYTFGSDGRHIAPSIELSAEQLKIIDGMGSLSSSYLASDTTTIYIIPTDASVLNLVGSVQESVSGGIANAEENAKIISDNKKKREQADAAAAAHEEGERQRLADNAAKEALAIKVAEYNAVRVKSCDDYANSLNDADFVSVVNSSKVVPNNSWAPTIAVPSIPLNGCMIGIAEQAQGCPMNRVIGSTTYTWSLLSTSSFNNYDFSWASGSCKLTVATAGLSLTDAEVAPTPIPVAKANFIMKVDLSKLLSSDSVLNGDASSFKFNEVNGVPFGTSLTVEQK